MLESLTVRQKVTNDAEYNENIEQLRAQIKGYLDEAGRAQSEASELKREVFRLQQRLDSLNRSRE